MDLLALNRRALDINLKLVAGLSPEQHALATPCSQWNVGELLQHLVDVTFGFAGQPSTGSYQEAADAVTVKFGADGYLDQQVEFPGFGQMPGRWKVASHLVDTVVHSWDINKALDIDAELDEELATAALRIAQRMPDTPAIRGPEAPFHFPVPVPDDAPLTDRLVALLGRRPH